MENKETEINLITENLKKLYTDLKMHLSFIFFDIFYSHS
jgi:hypothetical protein